MIHFALPTPTVRPVLPLHAARLTPAGYLQLRRRAAGLTIAEVASRLAESERDRSICASLVHALETEGVRARLDLTLARLRSVFPFDPAVYRQLADEPPHRHPSICRHCGCSAHDRCAADDGECRLHDDGCSRCEPVEDRS